MNLAERGPRYKEDSVGWEVLKEGQQDAWGGPRGAGAGNFLWAY